MRAKISNKIFSFYGCYNKNRYFFNQLQHSKLKYLGYVLPHNRFCSTIAQEIANNNQPVEPKTLSKPNKQVTNSSNEVITKRKCGSQSKEILNYLSVRDLHEDDIPTRILKRKRKSPEALYIIDKDVAKEMSIILKPHITKGDCPILEANPGLCFLSEELLALGINNLHLYEASGPFQIHANVLRVKNKEQVILKSHDLLVLYKQAYQDKFDNGGRVEKMLSGITKKTWSDDPALKIVAALPTVNFIKHLILSFVFQHGIMMCGRPELYLVMPPPLYIHLTCDKTAGYMLYRATTVLYQLIFKTTLLSKVPRKAYLPWDAVAKKTKRKMAKVHNIDPEYLYLVKVEARRDFFETVTTSARLQPLWYFTKQNLISRKNRVIPQLERWIPGCGPRLIQGGMNIFTQFGDLTPHQVLAVFNEFASWPEYPDCPFLPSMETNFIKMESVAEEVDKELEDEPIDEEVEH